MRPTASWLPIALAAILAFDAHASFMGGKKDDPPPTTASADSRNPAPGTAPGPRQQAEQWYGDAYDDIQKAEKERAAGKTAAAEKKFRRALERGERAVSLDSTYHEAWNLVGYSARKLKDYDRALAAYQRCLKLKPDYSQAIEYLGEAYVELGRLEEARARLAELERLEAHQDAQTLRGAIEAWDRAHPASDGAGH